MKIIKKLFRRHHKTNRVIIAPNVKLDVDNLSEYNQIVTSKKDFGYKGLKRAYEEKLVVDLVITTKEEATDSLKGVISHYDETYEQLLIVVDSNLKRVAFNQIIEVSFEDGDVNSEPMIEGA